MADNITLNSGSGGATLAADDISSVWYQIVKLAFGALDTATLVTTSAGLPVDLRASNANVTVVGTGTLAVQVDGNALTALQLIDDVVAVLGTATYTEAATKGNVIGVVRNDALAALAGTDNEIAPLQVNASGALYVLDSNSGAIKTAIELLDNAVDGNYLNVNANIAGTDFLGGAGAVAAGVQRTTLASNDPAVVALQIMDDWDESDRAKVNPIVGQAGIAAGAGAVG
ncbi:hypothetical protein LCGC14_2181700, partial [marine sediment metagenome]